MNEGSGHTEEKHPNTLDFSLLRIDCNTLRAEKNEMQVLQYIKVGLKNKNGFRRPRGVSGYVFVVCCPTVWGWKKKHVLFSLKKGVGRVSRLIGSRNDVLVWYFFWY